MHLCANGVFPTSFSGSTRACPATAARGGISVDSTGAVLLRVVFATVCAWCVWKAMQKRAKYFEYTSGSTVVVVPCLVGARFSYVRGEALMTCKGLR